MVTEKLGGLTYQLFLLGLLNCDCKIADVLNYSILTLRKLDHRQVLSGVCQFKLLTQNERSKYHTYHEESSSFGYP
jgi:hypothetical protein